MILVAVFLFTLDNAAQAQNCNRNCDPSQRDAYGCCKKKKKKKQRRCPRGQKITVDTSGHCCWPGQAWNGARCVGAPTQCPSGWDLVAERQICAKTPKQDCVEGMVMAQDKKHCCWPGQAWSKMQSRCLGTPKCPPGTTQQADSCTGRATRQVDTNQMVEVPAGDYVRGSNNESMLEGLRICNETYSTECNMAWFTREGPRKKVSIGAFKIDKFEVTNQQYLECVKAGGCAPIQWDKCSLFNAESGSWGVGIKPHEDLRKPGHPAICTSWHDANSFCSWAGKRLPTESEWEKAARGSEDTREFPWGDKFDATALNWGENTGFGSQDGFVTTSPVGHFSGGVSPYGAYDLGGNAMEWTSDWFDPTFYQTGTQKDPVSTNRSSGSRAARGGSWGFAGNAARVSYRFFLHPKTREDSIGFRCARGGQTGAPTKSAETASNSTTSDKEISAADIKSMLEKSGFKILQTKDEKNPGVQARVWIVSNGTDNAAVTRWTFDNPEVFAPQTITHLTKESGFAGKRIGEIVISVYVPDNSPRANAILKTIFQHR